MPKVLWPAVDWYKIVFGVVGLPLIIALIIILFIHCVTRFTPSGRAIFAIGGNERTARVAGMGVDSTKILVFAINGVLAALAGIFLAAALGDLVTYCVTALQMALVHNADSTFGEALIKFLTVFAPTQIPLAVIEGIITVLIVMGLETYAKPELKAIGFLKEAK